jgi:hypothetical protein
MHPSLTKVDLAALVWQLAAIDVHTLSVALHADLLDVGSQLGQGLRQRKGRERDANDLSSS